MNNLEMFNEFLREKKAFTMYHLNLKLEKGQIKAGEHLEKIKLNPAGAITHAFGFKISNGGGQGSCALWEALDMEWRQKVKQGLGKKS